MSREIYDDGRDPRRIKEVLLASGEYESSKEDILKGFTVFQKIYVKKTMFLQLFLVIMGIVVNIMNIFTSEEGTDLSFSYLLILLCILFGGYILARPKNVYKNLSNSLDSMKGVVYKAEIFLDKAVITTVRDPEVESSEDETNEDTVESVETAKDENSSETEKEPELPPATVVHLDNPAVEIVDCKEFFILYIKRVNFYVIPKSAFKPYDITQVKDRLSNVMGIRYREYNK